MQESRAIESKLDLVEYIEKFKSFLSRPKSPVMGGDIYQHYKFVKALEGVEFATPPQIPPVEELIIKLQKQTVLRVDEIFNFIQITRFFNKLKASTLPSPLGEWIGDINIPDDISYISDYFTDDGDINPQKEPELYDISQAIKQNKGAIKDTLLSLTRSQKLKDYLVDTQIHLINGEEALLVRGGFSNAIKATVVGRSSAGFFYVIPDSISKLKSKESELLSRKEAIIYRYCKEFSAVLHKWTKFLKFIDKAYDRFDHYQARVNFARYSDMHFVLPTSQYGVVLEEFAHPAIDRPKPISISLTKPITLITGVNAGGKTMLLKSILSSVYMSKYLLPMRCNPNKTKIGRYKYIEAIIDDPQSVKNDISTFAGRMVEFAKLFKIKNALVGVDEIELGTDADEAASLFRVLLDNLKNRDIHFVVTTHHKRLASLMAGDESVELIAAIYDEQRQTPTYTFLQGSIGKSYAFETAQRYGIPVPVVTKAKELYGEDKEKLNELIERSTQLESQMREKIAQINKEKEKLNKKTRELEELKEKMQEEQRKVLITLENRYNAATKRALKALKEAENPNARRLLNEAHKFKQNAKPKEENRSEHIFKVGESVKYHSQTAQIVSLKSKEAMIETNGIKVRVPLSQLKPIAQNIKLPKPKKIVTSVNVDKSSSVGVSLKLLGYRVDEALDELDDFIARALLHGLSEVEVIHGTGTGALAKAISEHLKKHPKVQSFGRVKGNMGATVVKL